MRTMFVFLSAMAVLFGGVVTIENQRAIKSVKYDQIPVIESVIKEAKASNLTISSSNRAATRRSLID